MAVFIKIPGKLGLSLLNLIRMRVVMRRAVIAGFLFSGSIIVTSSTYSHHSFAAFFNVDKTVAMEGVVKEFWFQNPHARIYLDVTNEDGEVEEWMLEGGSRNVLSRRGWSADTVDIGITVRAEGSLSRDGTNAIGWRLLKAMAGNDVGS